jgi:PAS domain S-box-containing protein
MPMAQFNHFVLTVIPPVPILFIGDTHYYKSIADRYAVLFNKYCFRQNHGFYKKDIFPDMNKNILNKNAKRYVFCKQNSSLWHIIIFIIFFTVTIPLQMLYAGNERIYFEHISTEQGLSNQNVYCIFQDSKGFMWFGTRDGLNKYDGYNIKVYKHDPEDIKSLGAKQVYSIIEDPNNSRFLWIGTRRGLDKFNRKTEEFIHFRNDPNNPNSISGNSIPTIYNDHTGALWIGTRRNGLNKFDGKNGNFIRYRHDPDDPGSIIDNRIHSIFEDKSGVLWIGTGNGGLNKYNRDTQIFTCYKHSAQKIKNILSICEGPSNKLWIGTSSHGLKNFGRKSKTFFSNYYPPYDLSFMTYKNIKSLYEDNSGMLWIGTNGNGLIKFNPKNEKYTFYKNNIHDPNSLSNNKVRTIYQDRSGMIWVGTIGGGINKFKPQKDVFLHYCTNYSKPDHNRVLSICEDHLGMLWIGTTGGLNRLDRLTGKITHYKTNTAKPNHAADKCITSIYEDQSGILWIGTIFGGLQKFDRKTKKFTSYRHNPSDPHGLSSNHVSSIYEDRFGVLWVGTTKGGLNKFNREKRKFISYQKNLKDPNSINSNLLLSIHEDWLSGKLWIGTNKGLNQFDRDIEKFVKFYNIPNDTKSLSGDFINCIYEDVSGSLWIGTSGGLNKFDRSEKTFTHYRKKDGLADNMVCGILEDKRGNLWISTKNGISRFNPKTRCFKNYDVRDGLREIEFSRNACFKGKGGVMFFGTVRGVTAFQPDIIKDEIYIPPVVISNFQIFHESVLEDEKTSEKRTIVEPEEIELAYNDYVFLFEFASLDYTDPQRNKYAYMMEGIDTDWRYLGHKRTLTFINLPPNKYILRVKATNSGGIWNKKGISVKITILPPYWQTWWFRLILVIALLSAIYLIVQIRLYTIRKRNVELEKINLKLKNQIAVRKRAENMLRESEEKHRTLVESIEEGIFTLDSDGIFSFINNTAALQLGGLQLPDILGKSIWDILPKQKAEEYMTYIRKVISSGKGQAFNFMLKENGQERHYSISVQPVKDSSKETKLALNISADITDQRQLEEQLRQSQKMEAIGKLAGGIAHDFNNLIAIIHGYSKLMLLDIDEDKTSFENVKEIDKACERAESLTSQLLTFSRRQILTPKLMDLNDFIRETEKMLKRLIREDIKLQTKLDQELSDIYADPGQIGQAIMNLVVNARDAMPEGGKVNIETKNITINKESTKLHAHINPGSYVMLSVSDTGIGMGKDVQERIFEPFFTTKKKGKGTGLGLSTVFGIVKQSNGYIWVDSELNHGTTFNIYLPPADGRIGTKEKIVTLKENLKGTETILVVEDEDSLRAMICKMLRHNGYKTLEAPNGEEALYISRKYKETIHIILTDVVMPGMNGVELVKRLKLTHAEMGVLYMSGYTDNYIVKNNILNSGAQFIRKPFTPESLAKKIRQVLQQPVEK